MGLTYTVGCVSLCSLNLHVKPGQLVAVVGQVGAGKSSLIQALLGEMEKHGGNVSLKVGLIKSHLCCLKLCLTFHIHESYTVCGS